MSRSSGDAGDAGCDRVAHASQGDVLAFDADAPGVEGSIPKRDMASSVRPSPAGR